MKGLNRGYSLICSICWEFMEEREVINRVRIEVTSDEEKSEFSAFSFCVFAWVFLSIELWQPVEFPSGGTHQEGGKI